MDTDKENPIPDESSTSASAGNANNDDPQQDHQDLDREDPPPPPESKEIETAPPPPDDDAPAQTTHDTPITTQPQAAESDEPDHHAALAPEAEIQESPQGGSEEINELDEPTIEDHSAAPIEEPSPLPPDLPKVSQDIDQYISSLSSKQDDDLPKPPDDVPIFVEQFAVLVEAKIDEYDSTDNPVKWPSLTDEDSAIFLEALDRVSKLHASLCEHSSDYKYTYSINRIGGVLQRAMAYLEEEFRSLLEDYKIPDVDPSSSSSNVNNSSTHNQDHGEQSHPGPENDPPQIDSTAAADDSPEIGYSDEALSNLSKLSKAMIAGGYETECCQVYFITRRNALEEALHKSGFEKHSIDDVHKMNWESLEREIVAWIRTIKQTTANEFPRERKLSDSVFLNHPRISEAIFCSLSRGVIVQLVNFSEAVAMTKRAAEKLFKFLDIYETLRDALPAAADGLFTAGFVDEIKTECTLTRSRLGEAMVSIFCELENSIKADAGKTPVPGGAVHPLTRYTINYLKYACEYKDTLEQVFREHQKIERADSGAGSDFDYNAQQQQQQQNNNNANSNNNSSNAGGHQKVQQSSFQVQLAKVMDLLDANLDAKSKLYRDLSLSSVFLMNNGRYILQKVRGSPEISGLIGDAWCRKRSSDLRQYHKNYQRETWGKPLNCLMNHEGLYVNGKVVKPVLKERFKSFNAMFDEIHKTQSGWVVSDEQLQSELRVSISNMVIPAYRAFLARYGQTLTPGRQTEKYVKYQPEDIETYVDELLDGNATPTGKRKL